MHIQNTDTTTKHSKHSTGIRCLLHKQNVYFSLLLVDKYQIIFIYIPLLKQFGDMYVIILENKWLAIIDIVLY